MRYKVICMYDGTNYVGWQVQPNGVSIQSVIEKALTTITKKETNIFSSGRTDALVHAYGQVFHFDTEQKMTPTQWKKALNANLPLDIRIVSVKRVRETFHARFDARWKKYQYVINTGEFDPFRRHYEYEYNRPLDVKAMRKAAKYLVGTHNFVAFNANSLLERPNQVRTLFEVTVAEEDGRVILTFIGDGFLRYMVRMMSQTLIEVGKKKIKPERIKQLLDNPKANKVSYNAHPQGLTLVEVGYEEYEMKLIK